MKRLEARIQSLEAMVAVKVPLYLREVPAADQAEIGAIIHAVCAGQQLDGFNQELVAMVVRVRDSF
ncbi:MAG TPA: hypothetical protein VGK09_10665 [Rhodocyclaceae bacterium]|jgi:hypothetical protein